jgi:hypothetical protein
VKFYPERRRIKWGYASLSIIVIEAVTDHAPFQACREITSNFRRLV